MTDAPVRHVPVMAGQVLNLLGASPGQVLADLTVGAGGHAGQFLRATAPTGTVIACDRDESALALARERLAEFGARVRFLHGTAPECLALLQAEVRGGARAPDGLLLDLGVSSMQLDELERGFSLHGDAPLDMRMDPSRGETAAAWLARASAEELERALREDGGEPAASRVARALIERRARRPIRTTGDLREIIEQALHRRGGRVHPATRSFQALRMQVNRELPLLQEALTLALALLPPGGVLAVLSFHSGEDRLVKQAFREAGRQGFELLTPHALAPERSEVVANRRSRSAHLRAVRRAGKTTP
ncbi:MAG: 16S rRNA (cytosine(1402)-N(4))-methyltransferase RsmH [Planctomycetota bacterium]